ncbi:helix-turn-helix domain-containing protein, partial [Leifsonia aquatica]|uniref:helix-turn-helix domain-containing protein n=1 Tax=Leifsonia aquatica TaxID=144185 RepID=UPI00046884FE
MANLVISETLNVAERLKLSRTLRGIDQTEMGRRVGASRPTVSNWERGVSEPSFSQVVIWARESGQSLEWLAAGVGVRHEGF